MRKASAIFLTIVIIAAFYLLAQLLITFAALGMALDYARSGPGGPMPSLEKSVFETVSDVLSLPLGIFFTEAREPSNLFGLMLVLLNSLFWGLGVYAVGASLYRFVLSANAKRHSFS